MGWLLRLQGVLLTLPQEDPLRNFSNHDRIEALEAPSAISEAMAFECFGA